MKKLQFTLNQKPVELEADETTPLLWVLRDHLGYKGTKFGCGQSTCGACTVLVEGKAVRSCVYAVDAAQGKSVETIEGLSLESQEASHPIQQAWEEAIVPQCGYCQPGFMMATAALLKENPNPTDDDIDESIDNICRCGTYYRMRKAIHRAAELMQQRTNNEDQP